MVEKGNQPGNVKAFERPGERSPGSDPPHPIPIGTSVAKNEIQALGIDVPIRQNSQGSLPGLARQVARPITMSMGPNATSHPSNGSDRLVDLPHRNARLCWQSEAIGFSL